MKALGKLIRFLLRSLGADLLDVDDCEHTRYNGQAFVHAFSALRHSPTRHLMICTQCGLIEEERYDVTQAREILRNLTPTAAEKETLDEIRRKLDHKKLN